MDDTELRFNEMIADIAVTRIAMQTLMIYFAANTPDHMATLQTMADGIDAALARSEAAFPDGSPEVRRARELMKVRKDMFFQEMSISPRRTTATN